MRPTFFSTSLPAAVLERRCLSAPAAWVCSAVVCVAFGAGCSDDSAAGSAVAGTQGVTGGGGTSGLGGAGARRLVTKLAVAIVDAGQPTTATCSWEGGIGPAEGFEVFATPSGGVDAQAAASAATFSVTGTKVGSYAIACRHTGQNAVDAQPPQLQVRAGAAVKTSASIAPTEVPAGTSATVTCMGSDAFGNAVAKLTWVLEVAPTDRADATSSATGGSVVGRKPGSAEVVCRAKEHTKAVATPAKFQVITGGPTKVVTAAAAGVVGGQAAVACALEDGGGNPVAWTDWTLVAPAPLAVGSAPLSVTTTKAGGHPVTCKPAGAGAPDLAKLEATPAHAMFLPGAAAKVVAAVKPEAIVAGEDSATVTCSAEDAHGNPTTFAAAPQPGATPPAAIEASVSGDGGVTVNGKSISGQKAGPHKVQCDVAGVADSTPATLTVKPGKPAYSKVTVPAQATAGANVTWACAAADKFGNSILPPLQGWTLQAPADCKSDPAKATLQCTKVGSHEVQCIHKDLPESAPAKVLVLPGAPVKIKLALDPSQPNYKTSQPIDVLASGEDVFGNPIADVPVDLVIAPAIGVALDKVNQQITCGEDGNYTLTATAKGAAGVKATLKFKVDSNGPLVSVSFPKRGATLDYAPNITITFSTLDELSKVAKVKVNGNSVAPGAGLDLKANLPVVLGLNTIAIEAEDEWGNKKETVQSFYAAEQWHVISDLNPMAGAVSHGLDTWLGQAAIDSGTRNHAKPKDLATVVEIVLKNIDLSAVVGASFPFEMSVAKGTATVNSFKYGDPSFNGGYPSVKLTAVNGGLYLDGTIKNVTSKVALNTTNLGIFNVSADATVTAKSVTITGTIKPTVDAAGKVTVAIEGVNVNLVGLDVSVDNWWGFLVNWLLDLFNKQITNLLETQFTKALGTSLAGPLANALQAFALNTSFNVPGLLGGKPSTIKLASVLQSIVFQGKVGTTPGGGRLGLKTAVASKKTVPENPKGSFARNGCLAAGADPAAVLKKTTPVEMAIHLDVVGELLMSMWQTGALDIPISPALLQGQLDLGKYGVTDLKATTHLLLPPLVHDCTPDGKPEMQIGDLSIDVTMKLGGVSVTVKAFAAIAAKVGVKVVQMATGPEIALDLAKPHLVKTDVDTVLISGKASTEATTAFIELLLPVVAGQLTQSLGGTLASFPLPELDLSLIATSIPKGTTLALEVQSASSVPAYVVGAGKVK
ncbi:MAG: hypothetical protein EXR79_12900 [Myxococcales bacterium]|nr:hypothetical protein [Myxococcales bacterium]